MYHLFNRTGLETLTNLNQETDRIIVGAHIEDEFIGSTTDTLAKELGLKDIPKTHFHTRRVNWFVQEKFPELLPLLINNKQRLRIYCDQETMVKLIAYWIKNLYPEITYSVFREMMFINRLNRQMSDPQMDRYAYYEKEKGVSELYNKYQPDPQITKVIQENKNVISLEHQLLSALQGGAIAEETASTIRLNLHLMLQDIVSELLQSTQVILYSYQLENYLGRRIVKLGDTKPPNAIFKELEVLQYADQFFELLTDPDLKDDIIKDFRKDLEFFGGVSLDVDDSTTTVDSIVRLAELYAIEDDETLVTEYLAAFKTIARPLLLIPSRNIGSVDLNLIFWGQRCVDEGIDLPKPVWT